jgi:hypothetical protein
MRWMGLQKWQMASSCKTEGAEDGALWGAAVRLGARIGEG